MKKIQLKNNHNMRHILKIRACLEFISKKILKISTSCEKKSKILFNEDIFIKGNFIA